MSQEQNQVRVFINYASEDESLVRKLYKTLRNENWIDPWLDKEKILPGREWEYEINKALENTDAVLICISQTSIVKIGYVQAEIRKAEELQKRRPYGQVFMIPVLLANCNIPDYLSRYQWVNISEPGGIELLIKSLEGLKKTASPNIRISGDTIQSFASPIPIANISPQKLRKGMDDRYDIESLKVLCFDLNVRFDNLPSSTLKAKIADLIDYCIKHDKYETLVRSVLAEHPYIFDRKINGQN